MRCDKYKSTINEFFNKALSSAEEHELEMHLAVCPSCRIEFQEMKRVDSLLREVVKDMMSDIEVPNDLDNKIKKALAMKQKTAKRRGLFKFLGSPAVAAALLLLVMGAGLFNLFDPYRQDIRRQVFMSDKSGEVLEKDEADLKAHFTQPSQDTPTTTATELQYNTTLGSGMAQKNEDAIDSSSAERRVSPMIAQSTRSREMLSQVESGPIDETEEIQKQKLFAVTTSDEAPVGLGGSPLPRGDIEQSAQPENVYLKKGSLEEAARETGINPGKPSYLPTGAVLTEVSWLPGVINQNYRVGEDVLIVKQIRLDTTGINYGIRNAQGDIIEMNGVKYHVYEVKPIEGEPAGINITIEWQKGMRVYNISGKLPRQDMIRIAASIE